jgi:hypothetical protein
MKLTIEHLAPYLPYGLKCKGKKIYKLIYSIEEACDGDWCTILSTLNGKNKPILRSISSLFDNNKIVKVKMEELNCSSKVVFELFYLFMKDKTINDISYETYIVMCKNHIDMFDLIKNNLAIDINTLN